MKWLKEFFSLGYYSKKCSPKDQKHYFKIITPTLARRVILLENEPCQCGHYPNVSASMKEHSKNLMKIINELK